VVYVPYADTDFFVALSKSDDRLNKSAVLVYEKYKGRIYTSLTTLIELALIAKRLNKDAEGLVGGVLGIAKVENVDNTKILLAAYLIKNKKIGVFDAFHAAFCNDEIISSDRVYDTVGIDRIPI
jgi:predicted nucleic acid-binding protein